MQYVALTTAAVVVLAHLAVWGLIGLDIV